MSIFKHRYAALRNSSSQHSSGSQVPPSDKTQLLLPWIRGWLPSGWRGMAAINIAVLVVIILLLTSLLIAATSATGNLMQSWQVHTADCQTVAAINTLLHLLINILSTFILASSNFFMQVLNAPTRPEVDNAHSKGRWLDIGIPSWRNAYWLSPMKLLACICLLITSMPIHLIFNSAIFKMDHRMGDFHATIASRSFIEGGSYLLPGASLITKELFINENEPDQNANDLRKHHAGFGNSSILPTFANLLAGNYSAYAFNISSTAAKASSWRRLEVSACREMFQEGTCTGLKDYRNVVMVASGFGWRRADLWNMSTTADELWEPVMLRDELNSLWYSTQCDMIGIIKASGSPGCLNSCNNLFSTSTTTPWFPTDQLVRGWNATLYAAPGDVSEFGLLLNSSNNIDYCLVEPREVSCTVAISQPLLLAVIVSITLKLATCMAAVRLLGPQEPLVTLGDAIASFISVQPKSAFVSGLMTDLTVRERCRKYTIRKPMLPLRWSKKQNRRAGYVPKRAWFRFFGPHMIFLLVAFLFLIGKLPNVSLMDIGTGSYEVVGANPRAGGTSSYFTAAIIANIPQIWLSFCYYVYNALLTRLEMGWEWSLFAVRYCPLRVTKPKGQQISTHRLQLPYKLSIPSMIFSILTHWLLSNALLVIISRGSYYQVGHGDSDYKSDPSLSEDAVITLSASRAASVAFVIFGVISLVLPVAISAQKLPGQMPVVGSNSMAIAAACRVSSLAKTYGDYRREHEMQIADAEEPLRAPNGETGVEEPDMTRDMALYRLKWGEVRMPDYWYFGMRVGHLSFGSVFDDPRPPTDGRLYR